MKIHFPIFLVLGAVASCPIALGSSSGISLGLQEWLEQFNVDAQPSSEAMALVNIKNGTILGFTTQSVGFHIIYEYLGVPYAKAPVGELRFQAPQPYEGWGDRIYNATRYPHACPQFLTNVTKADEDCLYLNIYSRRPGMGTGPLLPVVFFIHGGGFFLGDTSVYGGYRLLEHEIVLVTVQYRLGPLGFLYTGDDTVSANNGLKDMVQGLRWIQENIEAFGGDPNHVTVMGESAGGYSSIYMLISPLAQGLFHQVAALSGTPLMEIALDRNPASATNQLANAFNCSTENTIDMVNCLREVDAMELAKAGMVNILREMHQFKITASGSSPVIEGNIPGAFLTDDPFKLLTQGPLPDVPVVLGVVQHEGTLPLGAAHYLILKPNETEFLNNATYMRDHFLGDLLKTYGVDETINGASISQTMAAGYLKPGSDRINLTDFQYELIDMLTAVFVKAPVLRTADALSRRLSSVYLYDFEHYSQTGNSIFNLVFNLLLPIIGGDRPPFKSGISHADDLIYMFPIPFVLSPRDAAFSRNYCEIFTNFFIHGNPTPNATDAYPVWPKYSIASPNYMVLRQAFTVRSDYTTSFRLGMAGEN